MGESSKVLHRVNGVTGVEADRTSEAVIYPQYGANRLSEMEPMDDLHVLRAFEIYLLPIFSVKAVAKLR